MGTKKALKGVIDVAAPDIEEGTVILLNIAARPEYGQKRKDVKVYTYAALFVGHRWYVTGESGFLDRHYSTTREMFERANSFDLRSVRIVTETEKVR